MSIGRPASRTGPWMRRLSAAQILVRWPRRLLSRDMCPVDLCSCHWTSAAPTRCHHTRVAQGRCGVGGESSGPSFRQRYRSAEEASMRRPKPCIGPARLIAMLMYNQYTGYAVRSGLGQRASFVCNAVNIEHEGQSRTWYVVSDYQRKGREEQLVVEFSPFSFAI